MTLSLKIEAKGSIASLGDCCCTSFTTEVLKDNFKDILGKALYSVESQGYAFNTSEVYNDAVCNYEGLDLRHQFQRIYSSDILVVSVKIAKIS